MKKENGGVGEIPVYVFRSTILNELSTLLTSMGWQKVEGTVGALQGLVSERGHGSGRRKHHFSFSF